MAKSNFKETFQVLSEAYGKYKRQIAALVVLGFLGSLLEGVSVSAAVPLFALVLNTQNEVTGVVANFVVKVFGYLHLPYNLDALLIIIAGLFVLRAAVLLVFAYVRSTISMNYRKRMSENLFGRILWARWGFLLRQKLGYVQNTLARDVSQSADLLVIIGQIILSFTGLIMYLFVAVNLSPTVTFITLGAGAGLLFLLRPLVRGTKNLAIRASALEKETAQYLSEHTLGIKAVKAAGLENKVWKKGEGLFESLRKLNIKDAMYRALGSSTIQPLSLVFISILFLVLYKRPGFELATFVATIYLVQRIFVYIESGQASMHSFSQLMPYTANVVAFKNSLTENEETEGKERDFKLQRSLAFRNVGFSYLPERPVLQNLNFAIQKGETVGLVGPSGAGKTSVADLLLRLFKPTSGEIVLDGLGVNSLNLEEWRKKIGYVSQDIFLLNDTVENNIKFYDESVNYENLEKAAREANIYDFVSGLRDGFQTLVGDRGVMLSAGQRQRVVLARTLARRPEILVLDEATSALDNESELLIQKSLNALKGKITALVIAHRLSTVLDVDRLLVLDKGKIIEEGKPQDLLQNKSSYFYRMYHLKEA